MIKSFLSAFSLFFIAAVLLFPHKTLGDSPKPIIIVVSVHPLAMIAAAVVPEANIHVLVPAGAPPHSFSLKWSDLRTIKQADLVLWVSDEFEPYMVKASERMDKATLVMVTADENRSRLNPEHHDHTNHSEHHGHPYSDDIHRWLSPDQAVGFADQIAGHLESLGVISSQEKSSRMAELKAAIDAVKKSIVAAESPAPVLVYHDAWRNFTQYFHLPDAFYLTHNPEQQAGIESLLEASDFIKENAVTCALLEPQMDQRRLGKLVNQFQLTAHVLDPLGHNIEIDQYSYVNFLRYLANGFANCGGLK